MVKAPKRQSRAIKLQRTVAEGAGGGPLFFG